MKKASVVLKWRKIRHFFDIFLSHLHKLKEVLISVPSNTVIHTIKQAYRLHWTLNSWFTTIIWMHQQKVAKICWNQEITILSSKMSSPEWGPNSYSCSNKLDYHIITYDTLTYVYIDAPEKYWSKLSQFSKKINK